MSDPKPMKDPERARQAWNEVVTLTETLETGPALFGGNGFFLLPSGQPAGANTVRARAAELAHWAAILQEAVKEQ